MNKNFLLSTGTHDDDSTTIIVIIVVCALIIIAVFGFVIAIVYRIWKHKKAEENFEEHIYDIPDIPELIRSRNCDLQTGEIQQEDMQYNVAYGVLR